MPVLVPFTGLRGGKWGYFGDLPKEEQVISLPININTSGDMHLMRMRSGQYDAQGYVNWQN